MLKNQRFVESFFNCWSAESAYVIGFFAADGSMYRNKRGGNYIAFYSTDFELIYLIKHLMRVLNKIEVKVPKEPWRISYTLQIGSKYIYNRFIELGFTPNKSLKLQLPDLPDDVFFHFVRGYFDGDGGVYYQTLIRKNRPKPTHHLHLNLRCGNRTFLEALSERILKLTNIKKGSLYFHSGAYSLAYYGRDVIELYSFLYPSQDVPYLLRKKVALKAGIKMFGIEV